MSEYPRTGIDKALLKFPLQDRKISQIVSVKISAFFSIFARQLLPDCLSIGKLKASKRAISMLSGRSEREAYETPVASRLCKHRAKKITRYFFRVIFLFKKSIGHFSFTEFAIFIGRFI
ncbi:hypothetical protein PQR14_08435 [Paraburkholderia bryophila]|uniref:hypothetical protein n=1 Tax=Burkholderiaceae TaxID=119060 RepID=UPI0012E0596B|nr:hypothetical protein [Burkholderia sp. 9120]